MCDDTGQVIEDRRIVNTYFEMWDISGNLLDSAKNTPEGRFFPLIASLTFTAFTLEAFLNHIGGDILDSWSEIERSLNPDAKISLISEVLGIELDRGSRPWQIVRPLFSFRNAIAHGKTEVVRRTRELASDASYGEIAFDFAPTKWEEFATLENAEKAREDVERIVSEWFSMAQSKGHLINDHPFYPGGQFSS